MSIRRTALRKKQSTLTDDEARRFLSTAQYVLPTAAEVTALVGGTRDAWITAQMALPQGERAYAMADNRGPAGITLVWDDNANSASCAYSYKVLVHSDKFRWSCTEALSEIIVIGRNDNNLGRVQLMTHLDNLNDFAFGSYRALLERITYSLDMSQWLTYLNNSKASSTRQPDENYARELMQLFTIGLWELNLDGTRKKAGDLDPSDPRYILNGTAEVPTYGQSDITNMARVFTGIGHSNGDGVTPDPGGFLYAGPKAKNIPVCYHPSEHETSLTKVALQGRVNIGVGVNGPTSLGLALDALVNHPSCAPYIAGRLIRHMVTSNPPPDYVGRVASVFRNDGTGAVGNMAAVFRAIFTDQVAAAPRDRGRINKIWNPAKAITGRFSLAPRYTDNLGTQLAGGDLPYPGATSTGYPFNDQYSFYAYPFAFGDAKSVFGRWPAMYSPQGAVKDAGLVAPEAFLYGESDLTTYMGSRVLWVHFLVNRYITAQDRLDMNTTARTALVDKWCRDIAGDQIPAGYRSMLVAYLLAQVGNLSSESNQSYYARAVIWAICMHPAANVRT
jgi:uncharacterized protein (DUF1800 family)